MVLIVPGTLTLLALNIRKDAFTPAVVALLAILKLPLPAAKRAGDFFVETFALALGTRLRDELVAKVTLHVTGFALDTHGRGHLHQASREVETSD